MREMFKRDVDDMLMSPLAVNTDDMIVVTMPTLEFRYFDALPEKILLKNNGLTGKVIITIHKTKKYYKDYYNLQGFNF